jgi:hypothetical protein
LLKEDKEIAFNMSQRHASASSQLRYVKQMYLDYSIILLRDSADKMNVEDKVAHCHID